MSEVTKCPFCGGIVGKGEWQTPAGTVRFSTCCEMPLEFIEHPEIYEGLPEPLREMGVAGIKAENAAIFEKSDEIDRSFLSHVEEMAAKYPRLLHRGGRLNIIPVAQAMTELFGEES